MRIFFLGWLVCQKFSPRIPVSLNPQRFRQAHRGTCRGGVHAEMKPCKAHAEILLSSQPLPRAGLQTHRPPAPSPWVLVAKGPLPGKALSHRPRRLAAGVSWSPPTPPLSHTCSFSTSGGTGPMTQKPGALPMLTELLRVCSCPRTSSTSKLIDQQASDQEGAMGEGAVPREGGDCWRGGRPEMRGGGGHHWAVYLWMCVDVYGDTLC